MSSWLPLLALTAWVYAEHVERWVDALGFMLLGYYRVCLELARSLIRVARWA